MPVAAWIMDASHTTPCSLSRQAPERKTTELRSHAWPDFLKRQKIQTPINIVIVLRNVLTSMDGREIH